MVTAQMLADNTELQQNVAKVATILGLLVSGGGTSFGLETVNSYLKTLNLYRKHGEIKNSWLTVQKSASYCARVGVECAMQELGLSQQWKDIDKRRIIQPK